MLMTREIRTISVGGVPILEIIKEEETVTILEADDMDRQIELPAVLIPAIINHLEDLK